MCWWLLLFYSDTRRVDLKTKLNKPSFYIARANWNPRLTETSRRLSPITHALRIQKLAITTCIPSWQLKRETSFNHCNPWCKALHHVLYTSSVSRREATPCALLQKEASQRQQRRSANSVAASLPRRSVAASQRYPPPRASQRRSATIPRERHSATSETHVSAPFAPAMLYFNLSYQILFL